MPAQVETTHEILPRELIVYRRENSNIWQCRYKVENTWVRCSTKQSDLNEATETAREFLYDAKARARNGLPVASRKFIVVAEQAIKRLENDATNQRGLRKSEDYIRVLKKYHMPYFGKYQVDTIDYPMLDAFDEWRITKMKKMPSKSTIQSHNAALNRVFEEAIVQGYMTELSRPKLMKTSNRKRDDNRRPAFALEDLPQLLGGLDEWAANKHKRISRELGCLMKDYVCVLLDTGARPGDELLNLKWNQVNYEPLIHLTVPTIEELESKKSKTKTDDEYDDKSWVEDNFWLKVSGKTGTRDVLGTQLTFDAIQRIIKRNFDLDIDNAKSLEKFLTSKKIKKTDYMFRLKDGMRPGSFAHMFGNYLASIDLTEEVSTGNRYVLYSLRHSYATIKLEQDGVSISNLAKHMGTSVQMIEQHYSHLNVKNITSELRGKFYGDILAGYAH